MKIEVGMQFIYESDKDVIYTIYKIKDGNVWVNWKGVVKGTNYSLVSVEAKFKSKIWIPVEQIEFKRDELIEHELLDRISIISTMFEQYIAVPANNYFLVRESNMWNIITRINGDLNELYQNLGNLDAGNS